MKSIANGSSQTAQYSFISLAEVTRMEVSFFFAFNFLTFFCLSTSTLLFL